MEILNQIKLEQLLKTNWTEFIDQTQFLRLVLTNANEQHNNYQTLNQLEIPLKQIKLSITKFSVINSCKFEVWAEFSIPKDNGVLVGTHVFEMDLSGNFNLKESYGTIFVTEKS